MLNASFIDRKIEKAAAIAATATNTPATAIRLTPNHIVLRAARCEDWRYVTVEEARADLALYALRPASGGFEQLRAFDQFGHAGRCMPDVCYRVQPEDMVQFHAIQQRLKDEANMT